ncbi:MAG: hypothetical protein CMI26_07115 [Opitutae bacterium]|nr:hypothetical protein [Opitutae bacterium]
MFFEDIMGLLLDLSIRRFYFWVWAFFHAKKQLGLESFKVVGEKNNIRTFSRIRVPSTLY